MPEKPKSKPKKDREIGSVTAKQIQKGTLPASKRSKSYYKEQAKLKAKYQAQQRNRRGKR